MLVLLRYSLSVYVLACVWKPQKASLSLSSPLLPLFIILRCYYPAFLKSEGNSQLLSQPHESDETYCLPEPCRVIFGGLRASRQNSVGKDGASMQWGMEPTENAVAM